MGSELKNKNLGAFKSLIKLYLIIFFITVSITMYYDEEHSKLFTAFNHQVIKVLACLRLSVGREHFFEWRNLFRVVVISGEGIPNRS